MCPTGAAPNGSLMYQYLPNGKENVVRYEDLSSSFIYFMPASHGRILFSIGPLWTGLICTLLSLAGSRHSLTLPLTSGTNMEVVTLLGCLIHA